MDNPKIYFYNIGSYDYDEQVTINYYSYKKHTQKEFEEIVFNALKKVMNKILEDEPTSVCFYNIFFEADDLILEEKFDEIMLKKGFHKIINKIQASVDFTLHHDNHNKNTDKLTGIFLNLDIDESCKQKNCSRLSGFDQHESKQIQRDCGVTIREKLRGT